MKPENMYVIALATNIDDFKTSDMWAEFARTADGESERNRANRKALKYNAKGIIGFDREMDRLVKEYE